MPEPPAPSTEATAPSPAPLDPIPLADELVERLFRRDFEARLPEVHRLVAGAGPLLDGALVEVARRGYLERLLPTAPSVAAAALVQQLVAGARRDQARFLLAGAWVRRGGDYDRVGLEQLLLAAASDGSLAPLFLRLLDAALYERLMRLLLAGGAVDSPVLRALAAVRPTYRRSELNAPAVALARAEAAQRLGAAPKGCWDLLIVPGFTPLAAARPLELVELPAAVARVELALADFRAGRGAFICVSGGAVHPPGTPYNEGRMMRDWLLEHGLPEARLLVDPHARHSTTNLRNAGRFMLELGLRRALVVTGFESPAFSQAFYFGHPTLSTFGERCRQTLGYEVGELSAVDGHHIEFVPAPEVQTMDWREPLDP